MFKNELFDTKLRTWVRGVSRLGTLCGVLAMVALIPGCPPDGGDPPPIMCDDATPCEDDGDACTTVACVDDVCATSDVCPEGDTCDAGVCSTPCDDTTVCDDGNDCTDDACGDDGNCAFTNNDANACDDGNACTDDACTDGACVGANNDANACDDGDLCTDADACTDGVCGGTAMDCGDGDLCTDDECLDGVCSNPAVVCPDGETCDPATGDCSVQVPCDMDADCDDSDLCTTDSCGADLFCAFVALDCSDGDTCTDDVCTDGACSNPAVVCGAGESCVGGTCLVVGSFNFTLDDDTLTGTSGDDVFTAGVGTLNPADIAVGNGGTDTLNASIVGTTSGAPTLIDIDNVNFTTLNDATFDATNSAAIGTFGAAGGSNGNLTLAAVGDGTGMNMGTGFDNAMIVTYGTNPAPDFTLTLNGTPDGAEFRLSNANCGSTIELDVAADSSLTSFTPGTDFLCAATVTAVDVTGAGGLTLVDADPTGMNDFDFAAFTGALNIAGRPDAADNFDFSAAGFNYPLDSYTIADTMTSAHTVTTQAGDHSLTINIGDVDAVDLAGAVTVNQSTSLTEFDTCNVNLSGDGDGMGALGAADTEFINIDSGGTTANAIANVTGASGGFTTPKVTITGDQDLNAGTVTTDVLDAATFAGGLTATAAAAMNMSGGAGDDLLTGSAGGDSINGNGGDDTLSGLAGSDVINGGPGDDTLIGGDAADLLTGGTGADTFVLTDDDATDDISGSPDFEVGVDMDVIMLDLSDFSAELGAGVLEGEAGGGAIVAGDSTILAAAAGASTAATGNSETVFKINDTTGINSNADLTGDFTLTANTSNAASAIVVIWYDEDDGNMVVSLVVDAGAAADANVDISGTVTDLVTVEMSAADFTALDESNIAFRG